MLKTECRRAFSSVGFWVGAAIYLALMVYESWADYTHASFIDMIYLYEYSNSVSFMVLLLPAIAALPHGMSFAQDWNSRFACTIWLRVPCPAYCRSKIAACFLSGGACLVLPSAIFMLAFGLKLGFVNETSLDAALNNPQGIMPLLLLPRGGTVLFLAMRLLGFFLYGGTCALMALAISAYIPYGYIAISIPFVCLRLWVHLIGRFGWPLWWNIGYLNRMIVFDASLGVGGRIVLSTAILSGIGGICAILFAAGVRRRRENV